MTRFLPVREWGVQTLAAVEPDMPEWSIPDFSAIAPKDAIITSLSVAVVIMAETLLAENSFAQKNGYKIDDNQEILHFPWATLWRHLPAAVRSTVQYRAVQWANSIRQRHSLPVLWLGYQ